MAPSWQTRWQRLVPSGPLEPLECQLLSRLFEAGSASLLRTTKRVLRHPRGLLPAMSHDPRSAKASEAALADAIPAEGDQRPVRWALRLTAGIRISDVTVKITGRSCACAPSTDLPHGDHMRALLTGAALLVLATVVALAQPYEDRRPPPSSDEDYDRPPPPRDRFRPRPRDDFDNDGPPPPPHRRGSPPGDFDDDDDGPPPQRHRGPPPPDDDDRPPPPLPPRGY